ncbi:MAG: sialidase family protein [Spirochaetes bacterium]|jgi:hypothetical protein|nr:sialidase family protein [Spirochaetota bacterium]
MKQNDRDKDTPVFKNMIHGISFFLFFVIFFIMFSHIYNVSSAPVGWSEKITVTGRKTEVYSYHSALNGVLAGVVFYGAVNEVEGIYVSVSFDGGKSFFDSKLVSAVSRKDESQVINPRISISQKGSITVVWQDFLSDDPSYRIFFSQTTDRGLSWTNPQMISLQGEMQVLPLPIYDDRSRLHLIYHALEGQQFAVYHSVKGDEGFGDSIRISLKDADIRGAFFPAVVVNNESIYVVWQGKDNTQRLGDDLYFTYSDNNGKEWSDSRRITFNESDDNAPSMTLLDTVLYVAYLNNEDTNWKVNLIQGLNRGLLWEENAVVVYDTNINCFAPVVYRASKNKCGILWHISSDNSSAVFSSLYDSIERVFSPAVELVSGGNDISGNATALMDNNQTTVLWQKNDAVTGIKSDIYVAPPKVESLTHPFGKWSQFETAELRWAPVEDASGIEGYAVIVNREPNFDPTVVNLDATGMQNSVPFLPDGISYFHIRAVDKAGNYSRTLHFPLLVSKSPLSVPQIKSATHIEGEGSENRNARFDWKMEDEVRIKGYYYSLTKERALEPKTFITEKELEFKDLSDGRYFLTVRGVDKAGNPGRIATYELVIGDSEKLMPEEYEKIALSIQKSGESEAKTDSETTRSGEDFAYEPEFEEQFISLRVAASGSSEQKTIIAEFVSPDKHAFVPEMFYYSVFSDEEIISQGYNEDGVIRFKQTQPGKYRVKVQAEYVYGNDPDQLKRKSNEEVISLIIDKPLVPDFDPLDNFYTVLTDYFTDNWKVNSLFLLTLFSSLISSMVLFRLYYVSREALSRLIRRIILIFQAS